MSDEGEKKPYAKPRIERVSLVGEEMAGTIAACKRASGGGGKNSSSVCEIINKKLQCKTAHGS